MVSAEKSYISLLLLLLLPKDISDPYCRGTWITTTSVTKAFAEYYLTYGVKKFSVVWKSGSCLSATPKPTKVRGEMLPVCI